MDYWATLRSNLTVSVISLIVGALITAIATKLYGKTKPLRYSTRVERLALAAEDPIFGSVAVSWRGTAVRNLHMASVEIENASSHDFENVDFKIYTGNETFLLNERTSMVGTPYIVYWSDDFKAALFVPQGQEATPDQFSRYSHAREYRLPVFNRGQLLQFDYLCTRPEDDQLPAIFVSTLLKGARLKHQFRLNLVHGIPVQIALTHGLGIALLTVLVCGLALHNVWAASTVSMIVGLYAQLLGAFEYKGERWLRNLIVG